MFGCAARQAQRSENLRFLQAHTQDVEYLLAVPSTQQGARYVIETGRPVLYMGGFGGQDEVATVDDLKAMVANGELRYVLYGGGQGNQLEIANWLASSCAAAEGIPLTQNGAPGPGQEMKLYECR